MSIQLTSQEIKDMTDRFSLDGDTPNYAGMYQHIFDTYGDEMPKE